MESTAFKQAESNLSINADKMNALQAKLEETIFRAQRIANDRKKGLAVRDTMFGYDLQVLHREIRNFGHEISSLPNQIDRVVKTAYFDPNSVKPAQALMRLASRLRRGLMTLQDQALLAHNHIHDAEQRVTAWYIIQEVEQMAQKGQAMEGLANKIVIRVSSASQDKEP